VVLLSAFLAIAAWGIGGAILAMLLGFPLLQVLASMAASFVLLVTGADGLMAAQRSILRITIRTIVGAVLGVASMYLLLILLK
jgi:hypothetical protein